MGDQPRRNLRSERKLTGYVKKADVPDASDSDSVVEFDMPETVRDQPTRDLRAERKLTGYVKKADVPDASDSDSDSEFEPEDADVSSPNVSSPASEIVVVAPMTEKPAHGAFKHRRG